MSLSDQDRDPIGMLRILLNDARVIQEGVAIFDAIADRAKEINDAGLGSAFWCVQQAAIDSLIIACGRLVDRTKGTLSFISLAAQLRRMPIANEAPLWRWFAARNLSVAEAPGSRPLQVQFCDAFPRQLRTHAQRAVTHRHELTAHRKPGARAEQIGATFPEVEATAHLAYETIDAVSAAYFDRTSSLSRSSRRIADERAAGLRLIVARALQASERPA